MADDGPALGLVSVQTSWADTALRTVVLAPVRPPRLTTAVVPATVTPSSVVPAGKVTVPFCSHLLCGLPAELGSSAGTRFFTRSGREVSTGTNTESGTSG